MALTTAQKLRITEGAILLTLNAPDDFVASLEPLPSNVQVSSTAKDFTQIHWFVRSKADMEKDLDHVLGLVKRAVVCWIYYPKGTSGVQTDLTRDHGWERLQQQTDLQWLSLVSFDDTWSSFGMRRQTGADLQRLARPKTASTSVEDYVDRIQRTVRLPDDLEKALKAEPAALEFFEALSFTNRREYLEWVLSAKRMDTRAERVDGTVKRLKKKWKNPRNL
jgi:hypothetical protein